MEAIALHRIAIILPFAHFLSDIGAPVERGFRQAGLPFAALDNVNDYVPSQRFWAFVGNMARSEGIDDLGFRVGQKYGTNCADPHLSSALCRSPTLYQALVHMIDLVNRSTSRNRIGLSAQPHANQVHFFHQASFGANHPFVDQIEWFGLMALLGTVRLFADPRWQPTAIGLTSHHAPCPYIREQFPDTRILTGQPYGYISLDSILLGLPPRSHDSDAVSTPHCECLASDFVSSLKLALRAYIQESDLSIEFAAQLYNTSKRSLQRKLAETGTRYSEVRDAAYFDAASRLLQDPDMKVTDVAHQLGYSDSANFSRSFRRVAGINPRMYQQRYAR
jgi:AraC-like DNA-binding protein